MKPRGESDGAPGAAAGTERQRLFFAFAPDEATRERIAAAAAALQPAGAGRLVPRSNYHLTLAFIGAIESTHLATLRGIGSAVRCVPFSLRFDAYEYWPKPEVLVAAARVVPEPLQRCWRQLHVALAVHGWALEPKRLRPHVTLARKVAQDPVLQQLSPFHWRVSDFSLMRSDTGGAEAAYTVVATWPLLDDVDNA